MPLVRLLLIGLLLFLAQTIPLAAASDDSVAVEQMVQKWLATNDAPGVVVVIRRDEDLPWVQAHCPCHLSHPQIGMVQSAQDWL